MNILLHQKLFFSNVLDWAV